MPVIEPKYLDVEEAAGSKKLEILGGFHVTPQDKVPFACGTILLLGPGKGFWKQIKATDEMHDGHADPIDRWSTRVISHLADQFGGKAVFPFGGPPYLPFYSWALRTGRIWSSPVKLAVHDTHGLFVSFRGALLLPDFVDLPKIPEKPPCNDCHKPCLTSCPVQALTASGYEVSDCHNHLATTDGGPCMSGGCLVRRSCPVGEGIRDVEQSAYHMAQFHPSPKL